MQMIESRHDDGHHDDVLTLIYIKNTKLICSGSKDNTIRIWDKYTHKCLNIL